MNKDLFVKLPDLRKFLDANREFSWSIEDIEYAWKDYNALWYTLDCEAKKRSSREIASKKNKGRFVDTRSPVVAGELLIHK